MAKIFTNMKNTAIATAIAYALALTAVLCCGCDPGIDEAFMSKRMVTLSFDANGGNPDDISSVNVPQGLKPGEFPSNPDRACYTFSGWFDDDTLYTSSTVAKKDVALRAKWTAIVYTLTVHATDSAYGIVASVGRADIAGAQISISAAASRRYTFDNWSVTSGTATVADPGSASTIVTMGCSDATVTANFKARPLFTLTVAANDSTYGTVTPASELDIAGTEVEISATASSGYVFRNWSVTSGTAAIADPDSASTTVTMDSSNATITANFKALPVLTAIPNNASYGTVTPASQFGFAGTEVSIRAAAASGYEFQGWSVTSGTATIASPSSASTTVTLGSSDATVTANFQATPPPPPNTYTLTVRSNNTSYGTVTPSSQRGAAGETISISATAADGYMFRNWSVTGGATIADPSSESTTVTLGSSNATVTATFQRIPTYTLTVNRTPSNGGTVTPSSQRGAAGETISIEATPNSNYTFLYWSVTSGAATIAIADPSSASTTVTLGSSNATVTANFQSVSVPPTTYTLTVRSNNEAYGTVSPTSGSGTAGTNISIEATPTDGYMFRSWSVTSGTATIADPSSASTTVTLGSSNATVTANFETIKYTLTVVSWYEPVGAASVSSGGGTVSPSQSGAAGAVITIRANNGSDYTFDHWEVTSGSATIANPNSASTMVTLDALDVTVTAYFRETSFMFYGQRYNVVKIGDQWWMEPNINYPIADESWCYGNNSSNCTAYGRLYTWQGAKDVCKALNNAIGGDWHLPEIGEWDQLVRTVSDLYCDGSYICHVNQFGVDQYEGLVLKSTSGWYDEQYDDYDNGTNSSGFSALPGGACYVENDNLKCNDIKEVGYWWSASGVGDEKAFMRSLRVWNQNAVVRDDRSINVGYSVRCVK